jgi:mRNA-degrading endonuclease RelE of RelBE toxin-antitoxin system
MRYRVFVTPTAYKQLMKLPAGHRSRIKAAMAQQLQHEPTKLSKSRIKRLRGLDRPQYRLRVDDVRVFYDVEEDRVEVLAVLEKAEVQAWLDREGSPASSGSSGEGEG